MRDEARTGGTKCSPQSIHPPPPPALEFSPSQAITLTFFFLTADEILPECVSVAFGKDGDEGKASQERRRDSMCERVALACVCLACKSCLS